MTPTMGLAAIVALVLLVGWLKTREHPKLRRFRRCLSRVQMVCWMGFGDWWRTLRYIHRLDEHDREK